MPHRRPHDLDPLRHGFLLYGLDVTEIFHAKSEP
jgi:hypothetical protein